MNKEQNLIITEEQIIKVLLNIYYTENLLLLLPIAAAISPKAMLTSFSAENGHDGGFPTIHNITIEEVLMRCSNPEYVLDFLVSVWPQHYSHKEDCDRLLKHAQRQHMDWHLLPYIKPLVKKGANIHLHYDFNGQVTPMLYEIFLYNKSIVSKWEKRIKFVTNAGASLFDKINNRYVFEFLNNAEQDATHKDRQWFAQDELELPSALKSRCRTLLFTFATVAFKAEKEGVEVSAIMAIEPVRNKILDYLI